MNLSIESLVILLIVAGICGAIGRSIAGYSHGGCLTSIALGFIGALIGSWIARKLDFPEIYAPRVGDAKFPIVWAIIGSALFVAALGMLTGRRRG
jgi:uncharacterized membrane protein YeaQ/YmgE (transglycosylase-associated protein family)